MRGYDERWREMNREDVRLEVERGVKNNRWDMTRWGDKGGNRGMESGGSNGFMVAGINGLKMPCQLHYGIP